jgi:hypothetical protein
MPNFTAYAKWEKTIKSIDTSINAIELLHNFYKYNVPLVLLQDD